MTLLPPADVTDTPRPPATGRTLVLCLDGTGGSFDDYNTNVVKLFSFLEKTDRAEQLVYYQTGIGTTVNPGITTPVLRYAAKLLDLGFGVFLEAHVIDAYEFLMQNYQPGDRICLFGFSRGAYTVRALAGMLSSVGLLPPGMAEQVPFAYRIYKADNDDKKAAKTSNSNLTRSAQYKAQFSRDVRIEFIGAWDTVASVGSLFGRELPFTASNYITKTFRHAVSLDEHRARFQNNTWHRTNKGPDAVASEDHIKPTDVKEVWFAGCHSDVGGSNTKNNAPHSLSDITLRWMIKECVLAQAGIRFRSEADLDRAGIPHPQDYTAALDGEAESGEVRLNGHKSDDVESPTTDNGLLSPSSSIPETSRSTKPGAATTINGDSHVDANEEDANSPLYDSLAFPKGIFWSILEFLPCKESYQDEDDTWHTSIRLNLFRARHIPAPPRPGSNSNSNSLPDDQRGVNIPTTTLFHTSVRDRMHSTASAVTSRSWRTLWLKDNVPYTPRAILPYVEVKYWFKWGPIHFVNSKESVRDTPTYVS